MLYEGRLGRADADAATADDVLHPVRVGAGQARLGQRLQIAVERGQHLVARRRVQIDRAAARREPALEVPDLRHRVEQREPGQRPGVAQRSQQRALGGVQRERGHLVVLRACRERVDPLAVGRRVDPDELTDLVVAQRLRVPDQGDGGGEPLEVPGERADVRLVEVVHIEDQPAVGIHVGAEVLRVQIAVDPHPAGPVVQVRAAVPLPLQVVVEQARRAPVEGERRARHLAELDPEGRRVRGQELAESGVENLENLLPALRCAGLRFRHFWVPPGTWRS